MEAMDFHSLTRKELQTLCKKNKIAANMTNVAMADALAALENVEGLGDLMNQSHSPEKAVPESPSIPRTVTRTSTRRKPIKEDPETAQPTTRTRRTTRKTLDKDLDQENQDVNVPVTPAVPASRRRAPAASSVSKKMDAQDKENVGQEEVSGVVETPAVQTGRRRAQVGSARRKVEEGSVQQIYSTRRSVRLLEKTMADLCLNEKGRTEPVKMDLLDEIKEKDATESMKKNNDTVVSPGASFIESLADERELVEGVHEEDKSNDNGVETQNSFNLENHTVPNEIDGEQDETCDESDDPLGDNSDKANSNEMGPVDVSITELETETEITSVEVVIEPEDALATEVSDENSGEVVADFFDVPVTKFVSEPEKASVKEVVMEADSLPANESSAKPVEEVLPAELNQKELEALLPKEEKSEEDSELLVSENPEADSDKFFGESIAAAVVDLQAAIECAEKENIHHDNDDVAPSTIDDPNIELEEFDAEGLVDVNLIEAEVPISYESKILDNPDIKKEEFDTEGLVDIKLVEGDFPISDEDKTPIRNPDFEDEEFHLEEGLIDANLTEAEVPVHSENSIPKSVKQITPCLVNIPVSTLPIESFSLDKTDSFSSQFPRPTQSTPKLSSRSKKQATVQELTTTTADKNKENIDTSVMQLESKTEKVKKNKNTVDEDSIQKSLNDASLRQLTKMLKEKLQITNKKKKNEEQNISQPQVVGKRPALQALPENLMLLPGEPNKEN